MVFEGLLDPVFAPILKLPALWAIILIALLVSVIITIIYKLMTDQTMMKDLKTRQKSFQKKMKEHKSDPKKLQSIQKEMMDVNMKYMMQSLKPTIITFLPIILIFGWLQGHLAYEPIMPQEEFSALLEFGQGVNGEVRAQTPDGVQIVGDAVMDIDTGYAKFNFIGDPGDYLLVFEHNGKHYDKELTISNGRDYAPVEKTFPEDLKKITLSNDKLYPLNLFGLENGKWYQGKLGWLGTYILFSIVFSMSLRKVLKIY